MTFTEGRRHDPRQDLTRRRFLAGLAAGAAAGPASCSAPRRAAAKKRGGTLTVGMPNDLSTFDPHDLSFANFTLQQNLYDTLTRYDQNLKPLPGLAERWVVAPDGQSVTLTLRKGVKFHSGKDLVAADVIKNFEKAADKDRGINMLPAVANVAEVTAPDAGHGPHQVQEGLAGDLRPPPGHGDHRARRPWTPSRTGAAARAPSSSSSGCPATTRSSSATPSYWGRASPGSTGVVFKVFSDSDAMVAALQSGICDLVIAVPPKDAARLAKEFNMVRGHPGR